MNLETITLGAGCFWGVQHLLDEIPGVVRTECGYMGGKTLNPTYNDVKRGDTEHAEVVKIDFDKSKVKLEEIIDYFWRLHDPTQLNRQGVDVGTQYRSVIFYYNDEQARAAEKSKSQFNSKKVFSRDAVTQILPAGTFYSAEDYHQNYFKKNGGHVCHILRSK